MRRPPIFKQHDLPAAPMCPNHGQKVLMGLLHPLVGDQSQHLPAFAIEDPVQNTLAPIATNRDPDLLTTPPIATVQRRSLTNDGLIQHQENRALPLREPPFEPPLACRHLGARSAS